MTVIHTRSSWRRLPSVAVGAALVVAPLALVTALSSPAAAAGEFSVSPTTLSFPDTFPGSRSTIDVVVTNVSGAPQTPNFAGGAPGDSTHFGGSQNCAGRTFAPGDSCTFTYEFEPQSAGSHSTTTTIGIGGDNFGISMSGTAPFAFTVTPTTLSFPDTAVGASSSIAVVLTNISGSTLTPNLARGAPADPANFGGSQNCAGVPLPAGGSCQFTYEFRPATLGDHTSNTTIDVDGRAFAITMSGSAVSTTPTTAPDTTVPDTTAPGSTSPDDSSPASSAPTSDPTATTIPDEALPVVPIGSPIVDGDAAVIAQGVVGFTAADFAWKHTTVDPAALPLTLIDTPPAFVVATGPGALVVSDVTRTPTALLDTGEATLAAPGATISALVVDPADPAAPSDAGASAELISFEVTTGAATFRPGPGLRDLNLIHATLDAGESVTIASPFPMLVVVAATADGDGEGANASEVVVGDVVVAAGTPTAVPAGAIANESEAPVTVLIAVVGGLAPLTVLP